MQQSSIFCEGDEVIVKTARNPVPMTIKKVYFNQINKRIEYQCSWELFDGRIGNTIYKQEELDIPTSSFPDHEVDFF